MSKLDLSEWPPRWKGRVLTDLALLFSFFFMDGHRRESQDRALAVFRNVVDFMGGELREQYRGWRPVSDSTWQRIADKVYKSKAHDGWFFHLHAGKQHLDADSLYFGARCPYHFDTLERRSSDVSIGLPLDWYARHGGTPLDLFTQVCETLLPHQAYAGMGLALSPGVTESRAAEPVEYLFNKALPVLELDHAMDMTYFPGNPKPEGPYMLSQGLRTPGWLTAVSDEWLESLGGREAVRAALQSPVTVHDYSQGLIIQAGPEPVPGGRSLSQVFDGRIPDDVRELAKQQPADPLAAFDVDREELLAPFRPVARVLKPARVATLQKFHSGIAHDRNYPHFDQAQTNAWLRRFDD